MVFDAIIRSISITSLLSGDLRGDLGPFVPHLIMKLDQLFLLFYAPFDP